MIVRYTSGNCTGSCGGSEIEGEGMRSAGVSNASSRANGKIRIGLLGGGRTMVAGEGRRARVGLGYGGRKRAPRSAAATGGEVYNRGEINSPWQG